MSWVTGGWGRKGTFPIPFVTGGLGAFLFHQIAQSVRQILVATSQRFTNVERR